MIDLARVTMPILKAGVDNHVNCPECDGKGCEDCDSTGIVKLKRCSSCKELKLPEQFYGQTSKQSRCIPCYKATYSTAYRRWLRSGKQSDEY